MATLALKEMYLEIVWRIKLKIKCLLYFVDAPVSAAASDPLSEFCNDLEKAPDEVIINPPS